MPTHDLHGLHTALVTPFTGDQVDYAELKRLVEDQIAGGVDGIVAVGTTGESPTLDHKEHLEVIRVVIEAVRGRCLVIAGTGSNATREAIDMTREADQLGADAFLHVAPYYNKPSQEGLYRHFGAIAEYTAKPIILYSVPGRCGIEIGCATVKRIGEKYPHARWIKEAGGSVARVSELVQVCGDNLTVLSGDDGLALPQIAAGAKGLISVASNLIPATMKELVQGCLDGDWEPAMACHQKHYKLFNDLFIEGNPVSVKEAMAAAGKLARADVRLPLAPMSEANRKVLHATLQSHGLLRHGA